MTNMIDIQLTIVLGNMKEESVSEKKIKIFCEKISRKQICQKNFQKKFFLRVFDTLYELRKKVKMD